jgi:hypothetical protein
LYLSCLAVSYFSRDPTRVAVSVSFIHMWLYCRIFSHRFTSDWQEPFSDAAAFFFCDNLVNYMFLTLNTAWRSAYSTFELLPPTVVCFINGNYCFKISLKMHFLLGILNLATT